MKNTILFLIFLIIIVYTSCVSIDDKRDDTPLWAVSPPNHPNYYIGIGNSHTGIRTDDLEIAAIRARENLAAQISVLIRSDLALQERESSDGDYESEYSSVVEQSINENLRELETVQTYYSENSGYWVYVRLDRQKWQQIQQDEMAQLELRVLDVIVPARKESEISIQDKLAFLWSGWEMLAVSPYAGLIRTEFDNDSGFLIDLIERQIVHYVNTTSITLKSSRYDILVGSNEDVNLQLINPAAKALGSLPIAIVDNAGSVLLLASTMTNGSSTFSFGSSLGVGLHQLRAILDYTRLAINPDSMGVHMPQVAKDFEIRVRQMPVSFFVDFSDNIEYRNIRTQLVSTFSKMDLPFEFSDTLGLDFSVSISFIVDDFPKVLENAPQMSEGYFTIALKKHGKTVFSHQTASVREGGIHKTQAHQRVFDKLLPLVKADTKILEGFSIALSL